MRLTAELPEPPTPTTLILANVSTGGKTSLIFFFAIIVLIYLRRPN